MCLFYLIEQHSNFLLQTLQVLYMCTLCDSTNINTIIDNHSWEISASSWFYYKKVRMKLLVLIHWPNYTYRVIRNDCPGFNNLSYTIHLREEQLCFFYLIEKHSNFLLHNVQVLYMCTLCDSTNINTMIDNHSWEIIASIWFIIRIQVSFFIQVSGHMGLYTEHFPDVS